MGAAAFGGLVGEKVLVLRKILGGFVVHNLYFAILNTLTGNRNIVLGKMI